jgi:hypothetical protein
MAFRFMKRNLILTKDIATTNIVTGIPKAGTTILCNPFPK